MPLNRRHDGLQRAQVPELGKTEISYPTPNKADKLVIERVPIGTDKYEPLPYHSPHPNYDENGLILVWQGKVKAENNQVVAMRVYTNDLGNDDWFNGSIKYSGDAAEYPIWVRHYIELRANYHQPPGPTPELPRAVPLDTLIVLRLIDGGEYDGTGTPTVTIVTGNGGLEPGSGATARAIMNPAKTKVIALELLTAGAGYVANCTVGFSGGGQITEATAYALVQPQDAVLVKEEAARLEQSDEEASLFVRVTRIYETLPGPWLPFTRYDDDLGPIQGRRRAVLNTGQLGGIITPDGKINYESREGSAIVSWEIEETWSDGSGIPDPGPGGNPNPPYPIFIWDIYPDERGAVQRTSQVVVKTGNEVATKDLVGEIWTKVWYEPYKDNPYLLWMFVETWVNVTRDDREMTGMHGGGILAVTEDNAEPGTLEVETGFLVVESKRDTIDPDQERLITKKLSPDSAIPVLELIDGGEYSAPPPAVSFTGGTCGSSPVAHAVLGFGIDHINVTEPGVGLHAPPAIGFINGGGGGAFAIAVLGFGLKEVEVTNHGQDYAGATPVTVNGDGTGATATATLGFGVYFVTITSGGGRAWATLTSDNVNVADGDSVTIGTKVYTFKTTLTPTEGQVKIGANADASLLNLIRAINHSGTAGTDYSCAFANPDVTADTAVVAHSFKATAIQPGESENTIAVSDTSIHLDWSGATLLGGMSFDEIPRASFGGDGFGASGNLVLGHPVSSIAVTNRGTSYETEPDIDGAGDGSGLVATGVIGRALASIVLDMSGGGFSSEPDVFIDPPDTGGIQAIARAVLAFGIESAEILAGGSLYATPPLVDFSAGDGTGAAGNAVLGFAVASAVLDLAGNGYTSMPTASVGPGGGTGGSGAVVNLKMGVHGATVVNGGTGYAVNDILNIVGGTGTVVAQLRVTAVGTAGTISEVLTFVSEGDANGVFYRIGTNYVTGGAWVNPVTAGRMRAFRLTDGGGGNNNEAYVDRGTAANPYTTNTANNYAMFDLGAGQQLKVTRFSIRNIPGQGSRAIRTFKVQGSNNVGAGFDAAAAAAATWVNLDSRSGDTTMATTEGAWANYVANGGVSTKFRYIRVLQDGVNANGDNFFNQTEFEFYGDFDHAGPAGAISAVSVETAGVYSALAANPRGVIGGGSTVTDVLNWSSNGDAFGLLTKIGTQFGAIPWANPHTAGKVTITRSSSANGIDADLCDHAVNYNTTGNNPGEWMALDIGQDRTMVVNNYTLQNGCGGPPAGSGNHTPRNWKLQGSNNVGANTVAGINAATWADIDVRANDTSIPFTTGGWARFISNQSNTTGYRWFRILAVVGAAPYLVNNAGDNTYFLQLGEMEFYGSLTRIPAGIDATFDLTYKVVEVSLGAGGGGYESAPPITITAGGGTTATAHTTLAATGSVKRVAMTAAGVGYTANFPLAFTGGGGGSGATANAIVSTTGGVLVGFELDEEGEGYTEDPGVVVSGGGGSGATAYAVRAASGVLWRIDVVKGGIWETPPTIVIAGGGGSDAAAEATLDTTQNFIHRFLVVTPGQLYTFPPPVLFFNADGSVPPGLTAQSTLLSTGGKVASIAMVNPGTGYTFFDIVIGGVGTGATAIGVPSTTGSVARIDVLRPGLFESVPDVVIEPIEGVVVAATAVLKTLGQVKRLVLDVPGECDVAPTVVFTPPGAEAIYHSGSLLWPANPGFDTDPTHGIVVEYIKQVVPTGRPYPGRRPWPDYTGPFIDQSPYDEWRSLNISSRVNLDTLPAPITFPRWYGLHLPPRLLSIEVLWSDRVSKSAGGLKTSAHADVSSGLTGDINVKSSLGYHGQILGWATRTWFVGPPPANFITAGQKRITDVVASSGSVILTETSSHTFNDGYDDGGRRLGDSFNRIIKATDIRDHLILPGYTIVNQTKQSQPQNAIARSGGGTEAGCFALGTMSFLTVDLPPSKPGYDIRGQTFLVGIEPEQWRFNIWQLTLVYVTIPLDVTI